MAVNIGWIYHCRIAAGGNVLFTSTPIHLGPDLRRRQVVGFNFHRSSAIIQLDSLTQSLALAFPEQGFPEVIYWGRRLSGKLPDVAASLTQKPLPHAKLIEYTPVSIIPEYGRGFFGHPGLAGHRGRTGWATQFQFQSAERTRDFLILTGDDPVAQLELKVSIFCHPQFGLFQIRSAIKNLAEVPYELEWLTAGCLPLPNSCNEMLTLAGRWNREFQEQRLVLPIGQYRFESRYGRTSHEYFPGLILGERGFGQERGAVFGFHLGWSGNWRWIVDRSPHGELLVQAGELFLPGELVLEPGQFYETPPLYVAAANGLNDMSQQFHRFVRDRLVQFPDPAKPRLVHFNSWEAIYFDQKDEKLFRLVDLAASVGAERFVLDDGWFRGRKNDRAGLGDWEVDKSKYPEGLQPLIDRIEAAGMEFGIWLEPEMTNEDSDLFRSHPDWILHLPPYHQPLGRNQYVLNLARKEVSDYLLNALSGLLTQYPGIKYLKWDMNRDLTLPAGKDGRPSVHAQTEALYQLLRRVRQRHPSVEIESCASGGARADFGILEQTCRIWASDSNDAHERVRIQRGLSYFFPAIITGSHVGPSTGHQTKRKLSLPFRCAVALAGHMGMEIDLRDLSPEERSILELWTARYKQHRSLLHSGTVRRLQTDEPTIYSHAVVSEDRQRFLLFVFYTETTLSSVQGPLRITGLDPSRSYQLLLWDKPELPSSIMQRFDSDLMSQGTVTVAGEFLELVGITLPTGFPDSAVILEGNSYGSPYIKQ
ncbi:MAG: alpha-galactosidase [Verrucomicrobia bacterium]|nr:alpha-galactosidase [Verrucomicrobiota bacterium]